MDLTLFLQCKPMTRYLTRLSDLSKGYTVVYRVLQSTQQMAGAALDRTAVDQRSAVISASSQ